MTSQKYQAVQSHDIQDGHDDDTGHSDHGNPINFSSRSIPSSSPPSFRSRASSPSSTRLLSHDDPLHNEEDQTLAETFDDGEASDAEDGSDDRQRLMRTDPVAAAREAAQQSSNHAQQFPISTSGAGNAQIPSSQRSPMYSPAPTTGRPRQQPQIGNDGVFANLAAKPERGEALDEKPPTYEAAAADATPPYWETTITLPGSGVPGSDEVYIDGLPVGSVFSFAWNAMISMSFQIVGFLLTYLLHTTHAAKNGSRAGLGLTLVQYGFYMKGKPNKDNAGDGGDMSSQQPPTDPNSHDLDSTNSSPSDSSSTSHSLSALASSDWVSYLLMIIGWFILIRAVSDFLRARRHEQLVLQSPDRGLSVPVIAEGESTERVV